MVSTTIRELVRPLACLLVLFTIFAGCDGQYEETVSGVKVPIPRGMNKTEEQGVQISLPGFGGGQASFQGNIDPEKVIEFYKKEMPARGWKPNLSVVSRGGMLAYSKENKTVLVATGKREGNTILTITVGGTGP